MYVLFDNGASIKINKPFRWAFMGLRVSIKTCSKDGDTRKCKLLTLPNTPPGEQRVKNIDKWKAFFSFYTEAKLE